MAQHASGNALPRFSYNAAPSVSSLRGFLITCMLDREKSATKEAMGFLKEYIRRPPSMPDQASKSFSVGEQKSGLEDQFTIEGQTMSDDTNRTSSEQSKSVQDTEYFSSEAKIFCLSLTRGVDAGKAAEQSTEKASSGNSSEVATTDSSLELVTPLLSSKCVEVTLPVEDIPAGVVETNDVEIGKEAGMTISLRKTDSCIGLVKETLTFKEYQTSKTGGTGINSKRSHAGHRDSCAGDRSCFFFLKMTQKGVISIFLDNGFSDDPVTMLSEVLEDMENGVREPPQWCHRIVPVQETCALLRESLSAVVFKLVKQHLGESAPTKEQPLKICFFVKTMIVKHVSHHIRAVAVIIFHVEQYSNKYSYCKWTDTTPEMFQGKAGSHMSILDVACNKDACRPASECVEKICQILRRGRWGPDIEDALNEMSGNLKPFYVTKVLEYQNDADVSLSFFKWAEQKAGYNHEPEAYGILILNLIRAKKFEAFPNIFLRMSKEGCEMNRETAFALIQMFYDEKMWEKVAEALCVVRNLGVKLELTAYTSIIDILAKEQFIDEAIFCYKEMRKAGYPAILYVCKTLINFLGKDGRLDEVLWLLEDMEKNDVHPDKLVYNICICSFGKAGRLDMVWNFFNKMQQRGWDPDAITLTSVVEYCCKSKKLDGALQFLHGMVGRGYHFGCGAYRALILGFGNENRLDDACSVFESMYMKGFVPGIDLFNSLLVAFKINGKENDILKVLKRMTTEGVRPNLFTYNLLIEVLSKTGLEKELNDVRERMLRDGYNCSSISYNIVINNLCKRGQIDDALNFFQEMKSRGSSPDDYTHSSLIWGLCRAGRIGDAFKLFCDITAAGEMSNVIVYSTLLDALCKAGKTEEAEICFEEMVRRGFTLDVVAFNTMINCLGRAGKITRACELFRTMQEKGCEPDKITYTSMIVSLNKVARVTEACEIFDLIKKNCNEIDIVLVNSVINGLCKAGKVDQGLKMLDEIQEEGVTPNVVTYSILIDGLGKKGRVDDAVLLFKQMEEHCLEPNEFVYGSLMNTLGRRGRIDEVYSLLENMLIRDCVPNVFVLNGLLKALGKLHKANEAVQVFYLMQGKSFSPNLISYKTLISSLISVGDNENVSLLVEEMIEKGFCPSDINCLLKEVSQNGFVPDTGVFNNPFLSFGEFGETL